MGRIGGVLNTADVFEKFAFMIDDQYLAYCFFSVQQCILWRWYSRYSAATSASVFLRSTGGAGAADACDSSKAASMLAASSPIDASSPILAPMDVASVVCHLRDALMVDLAKVLRPVEV